MNAATATTDEQIVLTLAEAGDAWEQVAAEAFGVHPLLAEYGDYYAEAGVVLADGRRFTASRPYTARREGDDHLQWKRNDLEFGMRVLPSSITLVDDDGATIDTIYGVSETPGATMIEAITAWAAAHPTVEWHWREDLPVLSTELHVNDAWGNGSAVLVRWRPEPVEGFDANREQHYWPILAWDSEDNPPVSWRHNAGNRTSYLKDRIMQFRGDAEVIVEGFRVDRCDDADLYPGCYWVAEILHPDQITSLLEQLNDLVDDRERAEEDADQAGRDEARETYAAQVHELVDAMSDEPLTITDPDDGFTLFGQRFDTDVDGRWFDGGRDDDAL